MAHYILYFPGKTGANPKHLDDAGLHELVQEGENSPEFFDVVRGPDGHPGVCATWTTGNPNTDPRLSIEGLEWEEGPEGKWWLGQDLSRRCTPDDVKRSHQYAGHWVTLCHNQEWLIPAASKVPHYLKLGPDGELKRRIREEFEWYHDEALRLGQTVFQHLGLTEVLERYSKETGKALEELPEEKVVKFSIVDGLKIVGHGLNMNYRVTTDILCALNVFDEENTTKAFAAVIELPEIIESRDQKKSMEFATLRVS